ncbi:MAG: T9SS type A sorting domain-containing protein [Flavobacteriales bacterium]|nr:T9SS type A sorting domain-containing protein [Flavobacteriales bacterium]
MLKVRSILLTLLFCMAIVSYANSGNGLHSDAVVISNDLVLGQNYPNPAKNKTDIQIQVSSNAVLRIYNILGKQVEEINISAGTKVITLDVSDYQDGIYLYSLEFGTEKVTKRMTVKK